MLANKGSRSERERERRYLSWAAAPMRLQPFKSNISPLSIGGNLNSGGQVYCLLITVKV